MVEDFGVFVDKPLDCRDGNVERTFTGRILLYMCRVDLVHRLDKFARLQLKVSNSLQA